LKYTFLDTQRPLALEEYHVDRTRKHVISFVPIYFVQVGMCQEK